MLVRRNGTLESRCYIIKWIIGHCTAAVSRFFMDSRSGITRILLLPLLLLKKINKTKPARQEKAFLTFHHLSSSSCLSCLARENIGYRLLPDDYRAKAAERVYKFDRMHNRTLQLSSDGRAIRDYINNHNIILIIVQVRRMIDSRDESQDQLDSTIQDHLNPRLDGKRTMTKRSKFENRNRKPCRRNRG